MTEAAWSGGAWQSIRRRRQDVQSLRISSQQVFHVHYLDSRQDFAQTTHIQQSNTLFEMPVVDTHPTDACCTFGGKHSGDLCSAKQVDTRHLMGGYRLLICLLVPV